MTSTPPGRPPSRAIAQPGTVGVAVYDANCLFSKHVRYLLLGFAVHGIVRARWSRRLLEETAGSPARQLRGDSLEDLGRWLKHETELVRDGLVERYDRWIGAVSLPDPNDAHVVAAAISCGATTIVTHNLKDFSATEIGRYGIAAEMPDVFAGRCLDANPVIGARIVTDHPEPDRFLAKIEPELPNTTARLRALVS